MAEGGRVVLGLGARSAVPEDQLGVAMDAALELAGLRSGEVAVLATLDRRAVEAGVVAAAGRRGWAVVAFPAGELTKVDVPHPSGLTADRVGTASVAEAAALLAAGPGAALIVPKTVFPGVTVAVARVSR